MQEITTAQTRIYFRMDLSLQCVEVRKLIRGISFNGQFELAGYASQIDLPAGVDLIPFRNANGEDGLVHTIDLNPMPDVGTLLY